MDYIKIYGVILKLQNFGLLKSLNKIFIYRSKKKNRLTSFGRYLNTKQIIKNFYCNIYEQSFQNYMNKSILSKSKCISKLFSLLESRLDTVLYRACLVNSLYMSRQLINHKLIFLNEKCVMDLGKIVSQGDVISLNPSKLYFHNKLIKIYLNLF